MKIAIARQKYTPYGGAERFVARALDGLRAQGVEVTVIAREWAGGAANMLKVDPFYVGRTWRDVGFAFQVQKIIEAGHFDLVQSHERIPGCHVFRAGDGVHAEWLALRGRDEGFLTRSWLQFSPWHRYVLDAERAMLEHPDLKAVICISRMVRDDILRHYKVAPEKLHVVYNGLDLQAFSPDLASRYRAELRSKLGVEDKVPVFLFVGSGFARKGLATLIDAASHMTCRTAQFLIIGKDKYLRRYEHQAAEAGIGDRFRFFGAQRDVRSFLGAADAFVLPTLYEPLSNAVLEALASGLPAIVTTTCGAAELISVGRNGFVCAARDAHALATHLDALTVPGAAASMRNAARQSVVHLSADAMAEQMISLYGSLLESRPL